MAVPMSIHRYTCLLSALTISPSNFRARPRAKALLPAAVGPTIARSGVRMVSLAGQLLRPRGRETFNATLGASHIPLAGNVQLSE